MYEGEGCGGGFSLSLALMFGARLRVGGGYLYCSEVSDGRGLRVEWYGIVGVGVGHRSV